MLTLLVFGVLLYLAVLLSGPAERSIVSVAALFLMAGVLLGPGVLNLAQASTDAELTKGFAEIALISVLFVDGMRFDARAIREVWTLPGRALVLGTPLALGGTAVLAYLLTGCSWPEALLIGAVLSPTDPVFASAIVNRSDVPSRLRRLLNVESGLNDGLALPAVVVMIGVLGRESHGFMATLVELGLGLVVGVVLPWIAAQLGRRWHKPAAQVYQPLHALAIGLMTLALASLVGGNLFFAAFAAGVTLASVHPPLRESFMEFGESVTELLKLGMLLVFGTLISLGDLWEMEGRVYLFAILTLLVARPLAMAIALLRSEITWQERVVAGWFGPKGFASIFYGLLLWKASVPNAERLFDLVALVVAISILVHSSTDALLARWLRGSLEASKTVPE